MNSFDFHSQSEADTARLGAALAEALPDGAVVALSGPLGAGKTRLVQAIAQASGVDVRDVVSPTFVLVHEYRGRRPIYHMDVYRLRDDDEFLDLGPGEYFDSPGLTLVEWAGRVERCLPPERIEIVAEVVSPSIRHFRVTARGGRLAPVLEHLRRLLPSDSPS